MSWPLVTIVTPSFNQGRFIRATIESVLEQDYPALEYIVMDAGSTDETASVVAEYADRLTWISEPDDGQSHAINKGFKMASGEIVSWLNSDDVLVPGAVTKVVDAFTSDPEVVLVYGDAVVIDETGMPFGSIETHEPDSWALANVADHIVQPASFYRRDALEAVGWVDESLHFAMDWDVLIRLARRGPAIRIPAYLAYGRVYGDAKTFSGGLPRWREIRMVIDRYADSRWPPVFTLYAVDSIGMELESRLRRLCSFLRIDSELPLALLKLGVTEPLQRLTAFRRVREADGWIGRTTYETLDGEGDVVELRGSVPSVFGRGRKQWLRLQLDGRSLGTFHLAPGAFTIAIPVGSPDGPDRLRMRAGRTFVPSRLGVNDDGRRLAVRVEGIRRRAAHEVVEWWRSGIYDDGWASERVQLRVAPSAGTVRINGTVPDAVATFGGGTQLVEVHANGAMLERRELPEGPFKIGVGVGDAPGLVDIELRAEHTVVFDERPLVPRAVAYVVDNVELG